jgi:hypothetical protein
MCHLFLEKAPDNKRPVTATKFPGCSSVWPERLLWEQEVASSNLATPIEKSSLLAKK